MKLDANKIKLQITPHVLTFVLNLDVDSDVNFDDIENHVVKDPNLTATLLKVANSAFYSRGNEIISLKHAISVIGLKTFKSMATLLAVKSVFGQNTYARFRKYIWEHAILVAILSKSIAKFMGLNVVADECFIAGLLHDIGKMIMHAMDRDVFLKVLREAIEDKKSFLSVTTKQLQISYIDVGIEVSEIWNLPQALCQVIRFSEYMQEDAQDIASNNLVTVSIVSLANYLANCHGYGHVPDAYQRNYDFAVQQLEMSEEQINHIIEKVLPTLKEAKEYKIF